jgi:hypothetical protein
LQRKLVYGGPQKTRTATSELTGLGMARFAVGFGLFFLTKSHAKQFPLSHAMSIASLPSPCIERVSEFLAISGKSEHHTARVAMHLSATCNSAAVRELTWILWETIDPGSIAESKAALMRSQEWMRCTADAAPCYGEVSLACLRDMCRAVGAPMSGTKEKLRDTLLQHRDREVNHAQRCLSARDPRFGHGAAWPECPIRPLVRQLVLDLSNNPAKVTATECRDSFGISEKILHTLPCVLKRNPFFRSAPPMRLYERVDVRRAQIKANLHHIQDPEIVVASQLRLMKKSVTAETVKRVRREALQTELTIQGMRSEPRVHRGVLDTFLEGKASVNLEDVRTVLTRHKLLSAALAAAGLSPEPRGDSELCADFLKHGRGDVGDISIIMAHMHFLHVHTDYVHLADLAFERARATLQFSDNFSRLSREECEDIRESAKVDAMLHWIDGVGGLEPALAHSDLPRVLHAEATSLYISRRRCGHKRRKRR